MESEKMNFENKLKLAFLFILSYAAVFFFTLFASSFLPDLGIKTFFFESFSKADYLTYIIPVFGFFAAYILVDWTSEYFETKLSRTLLFPVALILISVAAYSLSLYWYFANIASLSNQSDVVFSFEEIFMNSHLLLGLFAAVLGWLSNIIMYRISSSKKEAANTE